MKIKLLINLAPLKAGGGQNVGLNFINSLQEANLKDFELGFCVCEGTELYKQLHNNRMNILSTMPRHPLKRMLKEFFVLRRQLKKEKYDVVYSYFGIGLFGRSIPQITGSADSNLYFPEIDFWKNYSGVQKIKKNIIDKYRIWGIKNASAVIYENNALKIRSRELFNLTETRYIKPSISLSNENEEFSFPWSDSFNGGVGLFLCGWQLNKNILIIPRLSRKLKDLGVPFRFVITADINSTTKEKKEFYELVNKYEVHDYIYVVGSVNKNQLDSLYSKVNYIFLLSLLESFSNNIIEAWHFKKPLVVADEVWSRSICENSAIFVNRDSVSDIAESIIYLNDNNNAVKQVVKNGLNILRNYPSLSQRTNDELEYIKYVCKKFN